MKRTLRATFEDLTFCAAAAALTALPMLLTTRGGPLALHALGLPYGNTRLWNAVGSDDASQIARALAEGADVNAPNQWGNTPLMLAAAGGSPATIEELLRHDADIELGNARGVTPLLCAIYSDRPESVDLLLSAGADPNGQSPARLPLTSAIRMGNRAIIELLLEAGADANAVDQDEMAALKAAIERDQPESVVLLRVCGATGS